MPDWNQILDDYGRVVWKHALRMLGNETDAADCFQIVALEAYEVSQRQDVRNWPGLLKRLATVRALDMLRARYRHATAPLTDETIPSQRSRGGEVSNELEQRELAEQLRHELAHLPADQAEAFTCRWIEGMCNDEVAERMEITANHAAVLIHRARATLRERLSRNEE